MHPVDLLFKIMAKSRLGVPAIIVELGQCQIAQHRYTHLVIYLTCLLIKLSEPMCVGGDDDDVGCGLCCQLRFTYLFRGPVTLST